MSKYVARFGLMRLLGVFGVRGNAHYSRGQSVVLRTNRGLEVGEVLCEATEHVIGQMDNPVYGQILREVGDDDIEKSASTETQRRELTQICQKRVDELKLDLKLVDVEKLFGGERIIVFYLAEQRVDFRELVKLLANDLQTRIEMRQIGVRDEAKLLADYGDCGKPVCCNSHLSAMPPVSMKMAKLQKATLDPNKISGRCGRLKCCLRYEFDTYDDLQKDLPPIGSEIVTKRGKARVINQEVLTAQLIVQTEDRRRIMIEASDVLTVTKVGQGHL